MRKLPRLTNSDIITIKTRPETIRAKSNGRMGFAPLFEEERRKKIKMLKNVVKIMKDKAQSSSTTTTTSSTTTFTTTTTATTATIKRNKHLNPNHGEAGGKSVRRPFTRTTTARTTTARTTTARTTTTRTTTSRTTTTRTTNARTTITTTTTTTSTTTHKITTIRPIIKSPEELLGLPEIPEQLVVSDLISISHNDLKFNFFLLVVTLQSALKFSE